MSRIVVAKIFIVNTEASAICKEKTYAFALEGSNIFPDNSSNVLPQAQKRSGSWNKMVFH
jgi:hypothetical protein